MSFKNIEEIFDTFKTTRVLVLGDVMIDNYVFGRNDRVSTEAPIPVFVQEKEERRLGGAGNVAMNLKALGSEVTLVSVIGNDQNGAFIIQLMREAGLTSDYVISSNRVTTEKKRIIERSTQLIRIDKEETSHISEELSRSLVESVIFKLPEIDVLIFQDYDKGVLTESLIKEVITNCKELSLPVIVDPKEGNYFNYSGTTLFKPNMREFEKAHRVQIQGGDVNGLIITAQKCIQELDCDILLLTLSGDGLLIIDSDNSERISGVKINLKDVSGAGDTVIAVAALCLSIGLSVKLIGQIANEAGALVCEQYGVVSVNKEALMRRVAHLQPKQLND